MYTTPHHIFYLQGVAHALIFPVVQQFTEAFVQALQLPDGPTSDSGLKMEVLKVRYAAIVTHLRDIYTAISVKTS